MDFSRYLRRIPTLADLAYDAYHDVVNVPFTKYEECGDDFILVWDEDGSFDGLRSDSTLVRAMCSRRLGVGASGLIVVSRHGDVDFEATSYDADGRLRPASADGLLCALAFSADTGLYDADGEATFRAGRRRWRGSRAPDGGRDAYELRVDGADVARAYDADDCLVAAPAPRRVVFVDGELKPAELAARARDVGGGGDGGHSPPVDVVFVRQLDVDAVDVRTCSRRPDGEATSGASAAVSGAIASKIRRPTAETSTSASGAETTTHRVDVRTLGGDLRVTFTVTVTGSSNRTTTSVTDIRLAAPARRVFHGLFRWKSAA